jgi:hypothetical protein
MSLLTINANFAESKSFLKFKKPPKAEALDSKNAKAEALDSKNRPKLKLWTPKTAKAEALDSKNAKAEALDSAISNSHHYIIIR